MAAFEGRFQQSNITTILDFYTNTFPEFGVLPEIAKALDELDWT